MAPNTVVAKARTWVLRGPSIRFSSPDTDVRGFHCRVDNGRWSACRSPYVPAWRAGSHVIRVRAVDEAGNVDASPASTVWTSPLDDRALRRAGRWAAGRGAAYYRGTVLSARVRGAAVTTRTAVRAKGIALVATKCRTCGVVDVYYGKRRLKRVSLRATTTRRGQIINIRSWGALQTRKRIRVVVVSNKRLVQIDGIGIRTR